MNYILLIVIFLIIFVYLFNNSLSTNNNSSVSNSSSSITNNSSLPDVYDSITTESQQPQHSQQPQQLYDSQPQQLLQQSYDSQQLQQVQNSQSLQFPEQIIKVNYLTESSTRYSGQGNLFSFNGTLDECQSVCNSIPTCNGFVKKIDDSNDLCEFFNNTTSKASYNPNYNYYYKENAPRLPKANIPNYKINTDYLVIKDIDYVNQGDISTTYGDLRMCINKCNDIPYCHGFIRNVTENSCLFKDDTISIPTKSTSEPENIIYYYKKGGFKPSSKITNNDVENRYKMHYNTRYPGQGILLEQTLPFDECLKKCNSISNCNGASYKSSNNYCILNSNTPTRPLYDTSYNYFYKENTNPPPAIIPNYINEYEVIKNINYPNSGDLPNNKFVGSPPDCEFKCNSLPNCHGFIRNSANQTCYLKTHEIKNPTSANGYNYYYKKGGYIPASL